MASTAEAGTAGTVLPEFVGFAEVPQLGLGLAALGRPGYINLGRDGDIAPAAERSVEAMRSRAHEVLDAAHAAGVRYFDCARSYGRSEEFLADWLKARGLSREHVAVGSKWGYRYTADWRVDTGGEPHEVKDHSLSHFLSQKDDSIGLLGDHLRLYQIHSATQASGVLENQEVLTALKEFKAATGVRLGLSLSGVEQGETLRKAMACNVFDTVQATYNLLEQSAGPALEEAAKSGMQVIVKEAMANGRALRHPKLRAAAAALGAPADAVALAAVMAQGFRPVVLSGAVTVEQLESNLQAHSVAEKLRGTAQGAAVLDGLLNDMRMEPAEYWQERSSLQWN